MSIIIDKILDKTTQIGVEYIEKNLFDLPKKEDEKDSGDVIIDNINHIMQQMMKTYQKTRD